MPEQILRIGIIVGNDLVIEALLGEKEPVWIEVQPAIGFFQIGKARTELIKPVEGGHVLCLREGMTGRVQLDAERLARVHDVEGLMSETHATRQGEVWEVPLTGNARGRVVYHHAVVQFQFVEREDTSPGLTIVTRARNEPVAA